jgi:hypothetical protein
MTQAAAKRKTLPNWARALALIIAVVAGLASIYWIVREVTGASEAVILDKGPEDGIKALPGGRVWSVVAGNSKMRVTKSADGQWKAAFGYLQYDFLAPAEFETLNKARRLAKDSAMAEAIGLTPDQSKQLAEQVGKGFALSVGEEDQKHLLSQFSDWHSASESSRNGPELALLHSLDDAGDRAEAAARQTTVQVISQIQQIVKPEQWQKFDEMDK